MCERVELINKRQFAVYNSSHTGTHQSGEKCQADDENHRNDGFNIDVYTRCQPDYKAEAKAGNISGNDYTESCRQMIKQH